MCRLSRSRRVGRYSRRGRHDDWDGDGDVTEGVAGEVTTIHEQLLTAIQEYAANTIGTPIVYSPANYPYWYIDTNANGAADADEINGDNRYPSWTPTLSFRRGLQLSIRGQRPRCLCPQQPLHSPNSTG